MLAQVRADSPDGEPASPREVLASLVGEERAAELIGEDVIVVDSTGAAVAPLPSYASAAGPSSAAPLASPAEPAAPTPVEPVVAAKPIPVAAAVDPAPEKPQEPTAAPKTKPPFSGIPADGAEYMMHRDRQRSEEARIAELRKTTYPNGQVPREVAFPPDPVATSVQGPLEVVNFTLAGRGASNAVKG